MGHVSRGDIDKLRPELSVYPIILVTRLTSLTYMANFIPTADHQDDFTHGSN